MKNIFKDKKYFTLLLYIIIAVAASTLTIMCLINIGKFPLILSWVMKIISPFTYGFVFAYLCNPVMMFAEKKILRFKSKRKWHIKLKRVLSIILTMLFVTLIVSLFIFLVIPQVTASYNNLHDQISTYISAAQSWADNFVRNFWLFNGEYENLSHFLDANEIATNLKDIINNSYGLIQSAASYIIAYAGTFVVELKNIIMGIIITVYFLMAKESIIARIKKILASLLSRRHYLNLINLSRYTNSTFSGFISGKILDSFIIGLISFIVFGILDMPYYPLISVIIGVTNVIPFFGPFIGAIPSAFIIFIAEPDKTILFLILILVIQQLDGNVIGPHILGDSTGMSALGVLVAITVSAGIFGIAGMFLGVPAFAVITTVLSQHIDRNLRRKKLPESLEHYMKPLNFSKDRPIFYEADEELPSDEELSGDFTEESSAFKKTAENESSDKTNE